MKRITSKTNPQSLGRAGVVSISLMVFRWCKRNIGINKRKLYEVRYTFQKGESHECGEYEPEDNRITIFWNQMLTVEEIIRTCIHEWSHYRQPILTHYFKYKGPYAKHPLEIEAEKAEDELWDECWKDIQPRINKK